MPKKEIITDNNFNNVKNHIFWMYVKTMMVIMEFQNFWNIFLSQKLLFQKNVNTILTYTAWINTQIELIVFKNKRN